MNKIWPALLLTGFLAGCGSLPEPEYTPRDLTDIDEQVEMDIEWTDYASMGTDEQGYKLPLVAHESRLFGVGYEGNLMAWNKDDGDILWEAELEEGISSGLAYHNEQLFMGTQNGEMISVSAQGGERLWRTRLSSEVLAAPQVNAVRNQLIAQTGDGRVYALELDTGRVIWSYVSTEPLLTLHGTASPKVIPGVTFAGFANGHMTALDNRNGNKLWDVRVAASEGRTDIERLIDVDGQPLITRDGMLVSTSFQGRVVAMDPRSGRAIWERKDSSFYPAVEGGSNLHYVDEGSRVIAVDARSGSILWNQDALEGRRLTAPLMWQDTVAVADFEGYVHLIDSETGEITGRIQADTSGVEQPLLISDDQLYVVAVSGRVIAISRQ